MAMLYCKPHYINKAHYNDVELHSKQPLVDEDILEAVAWYCNMIKLSCKHNLKMSQYLEFIEDIHSTHWLLLSVTRRTRRNTMFQITSLNVLIFSGKFSRKERCMNTSSEGKQR